MLEGYRQLSEKEIALANEIKAAEASLDALFDKVNDLIAERTKEFATPDVPHYRMAAIGRTQYQLGMMALVRAVTAPNPTK